MPYKFVYKPSKNKPNVSSVADLLTFVAKEYGNDSAYLYRRDGDCSLSFVELRDVTFALAAAITDLGFSSAHIAVIGNKCVEWLTSYFSFIICGGVAVPLDRELDPAQIRAFTSFADCEAVFYTKGYESVFRDHLDELEHIKLFVAIDTEKQLDLTASSDSKPDGRFITYDELLAYGMHLQSISKFNPPDRFESMCEIIFTSGTTGTSKGVMLSERNIIYCLNEAVNYIDVDHGDVLVSVLPFHHTYEMSAGIFAAMLSGCTVALNDNVTHALRDFKYYRPTVLVLVPLFVTTIYKKIMETAKKKGMDKILTAAITATGVLRRIGIDLRGKLFGEVTSSFGGRLHKIVCGGAPLDPSMIEKYDAFGINLTQGYGITECSPVIACIPFSVKRPKSCGLPLRGTQVMIDRASENDETGEIVVKSDGVMLGYYKNKRATDEVLSPRGWFWTGDCGYLDDEGFLYITGRKKNVIIASNGKNVYPEELEEYIGGIQYVSECAVVGRESDGDVKITALIYPDAEAMTADGITDAETYFNEKINGINRKLPVYKQIRAISLRDTPFPKTTTKKIKRHEI